MFVLEVFSKNKTGLDVNNIASSRDFVLAVKALYETRPRQTYKAEAHSNQVSSHNPSRSFDVDVGEAD